MQTTKDVVIETPDPAAGPALLPPRWQKVRYELIETWLRRHDNVLDVADSLAECVRLARSHHTRRVRELPDWQVDGIGYFCRQIKTHRRRAILIDCGVLRLARHWDS